jgi:hypothetical protein
MARNMKVTLRTINATGKENSDGKMGRFIRVLG